MNKTFIGTVVSNKMQNTIVVDVVRKFRHALYRKVITKSKKYLAHNDKNNVEVGDKVKIIETKPMSKTKSFIVVEKIV
ncbi:MAG: 30S ribosomal protein S17 [Candidatus Roizmanbacteria bacterium]